MKNTVIQRKYKKGEKILGCTVLSVDFIKDIQAELIILKHNKTGARIMQVVANDPNNLFNIFLPTYPTKSDGIAHILEHTTLCGSQKYPVRDSFFAMTKRSLNTFMNAMTGGDFTCYPASSMVEKDYFNLLEIYLDAVFYPSLRHMSFLQEGHRFEFEEMQNSNSALTYKGVVYNEMKGAMSNPQSIYNQFISEKLYPHSIYGINAGGEPDIIPNLTYEELKDFHKKFYHPSNAIFFFYGDIPLEKNLNYIDKKVFEKFSKSSELAILKKETRYKKPIKVEGFYPVDNKNDKSYFSGISWLTCDCKDPVVVFGLDLLVDMLTDYEHSPLKVALVNSGLGVDLVDFNIDSELNEIPVTFGVKGVSKKNTLKVHQVILDTLKKLSENGLSEDLVKSAFHAIEIQARERREPYGLHVSFKSILPYLRGLDPKLYLQPDVILKKLSDQIEKGNFFEDLIKKWFLNNPHRVDSVLAPDVHYAKKQEQAVLKKLLKIKNKLSNNQKLKIIENAKLLQEEQSKGDDIESINLLPCLKLSDIKKKAPNYPLQKKSIGGVPIFYLNTPTNGISYIKFLFNINDLSPAEKMVLPVLGNLLTTIGTASKNFMELSKVINLYTGGVNIFPVANNHLKNPHETSCFMSVVGSCVYRNTEHLLSIINEVLLTPSFADKGKVLETVLQLKTDLYEKINPSGSSFAVMHASRFLSPLGRINSQWDGIEQLQFLNQYLDKLKKNFKTEMNILLGICEKIFCKNKMEVVLSSESENIKTCLRLFPDWLNSFPLAKVGKASKITHKAKVVYEGCRINTNVAYVARIIQTVPYHHPDSAPLSVLGRILSSGYTHTEIREKGGAYGGNASHNSLIGHFNFVSYRDPNILKTMKVYDGAAEFVLSGGITQEQVLEGILQIFSAIDSPHSPAAKASIAHSLIKQGLDLKTRQQFRTRLLKVTLNDLQRVAKKYLLNPKEYSEVVISGKELFATAEKEFKKVKLKPLPIEVLA